MCQRNKRTPGNFAKASSPLLNRKRLEEVLSEAGVFVGAPLRRAESKRRIAKDEAVGKARSALSQNGEVGVSSRPRVTWVVTSPFVQKIKISILGPQERANT